MPEYQLEIKQIVDYPRCRIYRQFVQSLINDRSIRVSGGSGLFYYTVLCSYTNFRTSYRRIDGTGYTVYPGEWVCTLKELSGWFRTRFHRQTLNILEELKKLGLISFALLNKGKVIKYSIRDWRKHNTVLDYNCPCQKDTGFFFLPIAVAQNILCGEECSEMDILLDLWISAVYNDVQVEGSTLAPVVYMRNGTGSPLVSYSHLSLRWGISRSTVSRILKKFQGLNYITLLTFPGRTGTVIFLQNYLSVMFQISDVMIDKEEVAMTLHIKLPVTQEPAHQNEVAPVHEIFVPDELACVSKSHILSSVGEIAKVLEAQGLSCVQCQRSKYMLFPLSDGPEYFCNRKFTADTIIFGVHVLCHDEQIVRSFRVTLTPENTSEAGGMV